MHAPFSVFCRHQVLQVQQADNVADEHLAWSVRQFYDLSLPHEHPAEKCDPHELLVPANLLIVGICQSVEGLAIWFLRMLANLGTLICLDPNVCGGCYPCIQPCPSQQISSRNAHQTVIEQQAGASYFDASLQQIAKACCWGLAAGHI